LNNWVGWCLAALFAFSSPAEAVSPLMLGRTRLAHRHRRRVRQRRYRVFSNRADANHRYMIDAAVLDQMTAKGWVAEGDGPALVVMCAPA
jgi:hypothetical protein